MNHDCCTTTPADDENIVLAITSHEQTILRETLSSALVKTTSALQTQPKGSVITGTEAILAADIAHLIELYRKLL